MIKLAHKKEDIRSCYPVMVQLRPHLSEEDFIEAVLLQQNEGYHLVCLEKEGKVKAVAGYRISNFLAYGKFLYVDDLVTDKEARSKGHGKELIEWLLENAGKSGCSQVHLDSGVQRFRAHKFYFSQGMSISAHHFHVDL